MPTTTVNAPFSHAQVFGTLGHAYLFAQQRILLELQDQLNAMNLGVVPLVGELSGTGTDTLRVEDYGNVGWSLPFTALTGETDTVAPSPINIGYETITTGMFGLAHQETYSQQVYSRQQAISLDALKAMVPTSWMATWRQQWAITGSGFTTAVGSAATTLSVDDWLDLRTDYNTALGSKIPMVALKPIQLDQLQRSFRTEPAFTASSDDFASLMAIQAGADGSVLQIHRNFAKMRMDIAVTDDIQESGGAYQGFAHSPGGIGWAVAATSPIRPANTNGAVYIPQFGLFIEELTDGGRQTTREYRASTWFGFMKGSERVFTQRRVISTT